MMRNIVIGTRGSQLAIKQTEIIQHQLQKLYPNLNIELKIIKTEGDKNFSPVPLDTVGKGWFTKEIEEELLKGTIDLAVHSLKDLPEELPKGLVIGAIGKRGDIRDVLVSPKGILLKDFPQNSVIGTDSIRRKIQILKINPNVVVKSVRGNVNTRLAKLDTGEYNGLILAAAGLQRIDKDSLITEYFDPNVIMPAPGQGALAVEIRKSDEEIDEILKKINDKNTFRAVSAERAFSGAIGGGCKFPIGSFAEFEEDSLILHGLIGSIDGKQILIDTLKGRTEGPEKLGKDLAVQMLKQFSPEWAHG